MFSLHIVLRPNITDITITPSPSDNLLLHEFNDTVSLTCTADGGPRIMTRWQFDDASSVETIADGNSSVTYVVSSLSTDHTGVYYCEAIIDGVTDTSMNYSLYGGYRDLWLLCILSVYQNIFKPGACRPKAGSRLVSRDHFHADISMRVCVSVCVHPQGHE